MDNPGNPIKDVHWEEPQGNDKSVDNQNPKVMSEDDVQKEGAPDTTGHVKTHVNHEMDGANCPQARHFCRKEPIEQNSHDKQGVPRRPVDNQRGPGTQGQQPVPGEHQGADSTTTRCRDSAPIVIPSGKHAGQSFAEAHSDMCYVHQVWNRKAVSP